MAYLQENYFIDLEDFLDRFRNENGSDMDSYNETLYEKDENGKTIEIDFWEELDKIMKANGISYETQNCGGFSSPGYDITCYCIAFINNGKIVTTPVAFEIM